jgi:enterochelin esterase-like enzyme
VTLRAAVFALLFALCGVAVATRAGAAPRALPPSFVRIRSGPDGGTIWLGRIPNAEVPPDRRLSAVYLPPQASREARYPLVIVLHGLPGSPSSIYDSLRFASVADRLIGEGAVAPFVAVIPYGGSRVDPATAEWAGAWEDYVVRDVLPWADAHLPVRLDAAGRVLAGLCAGGYGAVDIGLRHAGLFGTLESWGGYFRPFSDGPFVHAPERFVDAHTPTILVREQAARLRRDGVRFFLSTGGNHGEVRAAWTLAFAAELQRLGLPQRLWLLPPSERGHFWGAQLPAALGYAVPSEAAAKAGGP